MSLIKRNIASNFLASGWIAALNIAFVPVYIRMIGIEAYGLVGFFATLQSVLNLLDLGLSPAINRQMARYSTQPEKAEEARDLVRTLEVGYWGLALLIGYGVVTIAPVIAYQWIHAVQMPRQTIAQAIMLMGVVASCQWPLSFYSGGLQGLQKQVLLSGINVCAATLRFGGAAVVLWTVSPTIYAFFVWQAVASAAHAVVLTLFFWHSLPAANHPPRFHLRLVSVIGRFAGGMGGITVVTLVLTQLDKIILSKVVSLETFGYYVLAGLISNGLATLGGPVFTALYPSFSELVAKGDVTKLREIYHRGSQLMAATVLPVAVIVTLFSREIVLLWTGEFTTAENTYRIVGFLVVGTALNSLMSLPYALQLAHGWTKLTFYTNLLAIIVLVPLLIVLTSLYGVVGTASVWVILNGSYVLVVVQIMHQRLLRNDQWRWYFEDVGRPLIASLLVGVMGRLTIHMPMAPILFVASLSALLTVALGAAILSAPLMRGWLGGQLRNLPTYHE